MVSWGNAAGGGDSSAVSEQLQDDVLTLLRLTMPSRPEERRFCGELGGRRVRRCDPHLGLGDAGVNEVIATHRALQPGLPMAP